MTPTGCASNAFDEFFELGVWKQHREVLKRSFIQKGIDTNDEAFKIEDANSTATLCSLP